MQLSHGPGKIFQHLGHFSPSAFFTKTFIPFNSSSLKRFSSSIIFFDSAFDVIKHSERLKSLINSI